MLMAEVQADVGANSRRRARVRRSSSPSPPVSQNHGHGSSSASAYHASLPFMPSTIKNYSIGIPDHASLPAPTNPLHQASPSQDTAAASSFLATDHGLHYAPPRSRRFDVFLFRSLQLVVETPRFSSWLLLLHLLRLTFGCRGRVLFPLIKLSPKISFVGAS